MESLDAMLMLNMEVLPTPRQDREGITSADRPRIKRVMDSDMDIWILDIRFLSLDFCDL